MASRPDEPGCTGIGPEESDTPPDDLPNIPGDGDVLDPEPPDGPEGAEIGTETADISGAVPGDD